MEKRRNKGHERKSKYLSAAIVRPSEISEDVNVRASAKSMISPSSVTSTLGVETA